MSQLEDEPPGGNVGLGDSLCLLNVPTTSAVYTNYILAQLKRGPPDPERPMSDVSPGPGGSACPDPPSQGARSCVDTLGAGATLHAAVLGRAITVAKYPFTSCTEPCSTLPVTRSATGLPHDPPLRPDLGPLIKTLPKPNICRAVWGPHVFPI